MGPEADLHRSIFGKSYVHAACHKVRIERPTSAIESKSSADWTGVSQQAGNRAYEPKACRTPYSGSTIVRSMPDTARMNSVPFVKVQRCGRQEDVNGRHDVIRFGRYRMGAAFGIKLQVCLP